MMNEILDDDFENAPELDEIPTENLLMKALGYIIIMFVGGYFFSRFSQPLINSFLGSFGFIILVFILTITMESFRWFWKKIKRNKTQFLNPYWFEFIENMMSIWVILIFFNIVIFVLKLF